MSQQNSESLAELPRIAVIGCGAAASKYCLPALTAYADFAERVVLIDRDPERAASVAAQWGIRSSGSDYQELPADVAAAMITTPHHLHAEQAVHLLNSGKHVLVEKPLGMTAAEASQVLSAAERAGKSVMVNNCRRLFPAYRRVREILASGELGAISSISVSDGAPFDWQSASDFYVRNIRIAKGVLLDRGAHTVDVVCWWLHGTPDVTASKSDNFGGGEASMDIELAYKGIPISLNFSRLVRPENRYRVECEHGTIWGDLFNATTCHVVREGVDEAIVEKSTCRLYDDYAIKLVRNFIEVIQGREQPLVTATDVLPSITVMEEAYEKAVPYRLSWYADDPNIAALAAAKSDQETP